MCKEIRHKLLMFPEQLRGAPRILVSCSGYDHVYSRVHSGFYATGLTLRSPAPPHPTYSTHCANQSHRRAKGNWHMR
ncbi:MAG: hypothetical protein IPI89_02855 [Propionivibrio sp.]|nr:hypothetical protein [Propionivibrio sp.]